MDIQGIKVAVEKAFPGCDVTINGHPNVGIQVRDRANPQLFVTTTYHVDSSTHATPEFVVKHLSALASPALLDKRRKARIWEAIRACSV